MVAIFPLKKKKQKTTNQSWHIPKISPLPTYCGILVSFFFEQKHSGEIAPQFQWISPTPASTPWLLASVARTSPAAPHSKRQLQTSLQPAAPAAAAPLRARQHHRAAACWPWNSFVPSHRSGALFLQVEKGKGWKGMGKPGEKTEISEKWEVTTPDHLNIESNRLKGLQKEHGSQLWVMIVMFMYFTRSATNGGKTTGKHSVLLNQRCKVVMWYIQYMVLLQELLHPPRASRDDCGERIASVGTPLRAAFTVYLLLGILCSLSKVPL